MAQDKKDSRRGGLGRGLAALIPTAPEQNPAVGDNAADIIFGPKSRRPDSSGLAQADRIAGRNTMRRDSSQKRHSDEYGSTGGSPMKRHSDETANRRQASADVSRETQGSVRGETSGTAGGSGPEGSEQALSLIHI